MVATAVLVAATAHGQQVYVDFDRDAIGSSYESFDWAPTPETSLENEAPLLHAQIVTEIEAHLAEAGLVKADLLPDLLVTYHTGIAGLVRLDASSYGYDYGPGWVWDPSWGDAAGDYSQKVRTYPQGSLIIDIWDLAAERVVWRGTVVGLVPENPEDAAAQIEAALRAIVDRWSAMRDAARLQRDAGAEELSRPPSRH
jgi:hypothetical protein